MPDDAPRAISQPSARQQLGRNGERFAAGWLEARGYRIVALTWRCPSGELDLVGERDGELVFIEVRTRRGREMGAPEEAITRTKRLRLIAAAQEYLAALGSPERPFRMDVVAVELAPSGRLFDVRHYPNSVGSEE
jgi:putative endonuclease